MMQNWEALQPAANYEQHNSWYSNMFATNIKSERITSPEPSSSSTTATSQLEHYLNLKQQQHQHITAMDSMSVMTPSPSNTDSMQHFFDSTLQQQILHQQQQQQQQQHQHQQYQQQFQAAQTAAAAAAASTSVTSHSLQHHHHTIGLNPLTPPGLPSAILPPMPHFYSDSNVRNNQQTPSPQPSAISLATTNDSTKIEASLTPRHTPPMDVTPPKSPKQSQLIFSESSSVMPLVTEKDADLISNSSEEMKYLGESEDDESIRLPIYNSHGKMKNYKCKTCGLVAITKVAFWEHARSHMKPEKTLQCSKCPFVTELKHHLEYHIRKHKNLKPFQCDKCSYSCVNKSMLNSHRKSHSSVYQYRCSDCDYATKYCHSFKLHLRKYDHKPGMVLDEDGAPNPSVVIDVYGTRRGPKMKAGPGSHSAGNKRGEKLTTANLSKQQTVQDMKIPNSQLSAALQGFQLGHHQMPASPAKSTTSSSSDLLPSLHQQHHQQKKEPQQQMQNLLPPLASILQQGHNMGFFPYWNLNLQMLAAQQQAAVLAQLSPGLRETALPNHQKQQEVNDAMAITDDSDGDDDNDDDEFDTKSEGSAMDLTQVTPTKRDQQQDLSTATAQMMMPAPAAINLKMSDEDAATPLISSSSSSRRKGRVLKLDASLPKSNLSSPLPSPTQSAPEFPTSSTTPHRVSVTPAKSVSPADDTIGTSAASTSTAPQSKQSSGTGTTNSRSNTITPPGCIFECKYCDIYFRDAVLYTIHMGYHSCDDVFKCNMCGEKCDGPVGLFVHMARNPHS